MKEGKEREDKKQEGLRGMGRKKQRGKEKKRQEKQHGTGKIDYSRYRFSGKEKLRYVLTGSLLGLGIVWLVYHRLAALPLAGVCLACYLVMTSKRLAAERRKTLQYHFRDFLSSLHTSLAAGYSMENGVRSAAGDIQKLYGEKGPLTAELKDILRQMSYQRPVEQLFRELGERSGAEDIRHFGEILVIAKRTGGNMDQVLEATWRNLCEKIDTAKEIDALVAAKRYEQQMMSLMPAGMILYLEVGFDGFLDPMYGSTAGVLIMTGCLGVYLAAYFLGKHMTEKLEV